jgi:hypothetical protein
MLFREAAERKQKGNDAEKGDGSEVTRRYTTTDDAPRIRTHSEPIKHLPKHWTRSFSSPSSRIPLLYLIRPLESFSEHLFLQTGRHGDSWTKRMIVEFMVSATEAPRNAKKVVLECCTIYVTSDLQRRNNTEAT